MRNLLFTLIVLVCASPLFAQSITGYEYWFDQNDNDVQRVFVSVSGTSFLNLTNENISHTLEAGLHRLHFRMKQSNGAWSAVCHRDFLVIDDVLPNQMTGYEYWFDQDDANRTYVSAAPQQVMSLQNQTFYYPENLSPGLHQLCLRMKDIHGKWSSVNHRRIYIAPPPFEVQLVRFRYWSEQVNVDPSDMTIVELEQPVTYLDLSNHVDFCEFESAGITTLFFQMQDNRGYWSSVVSRNTTIDEIITTPELPVINGENELCENSSASFSASSAGASWFEWSLPPGWDGTGDSSQIHVTTGTTGGTVTVIPHNNCGAGAPQTFTVSTITAVTPAVEISTTDFPACENTEVTISSIANNSGDQPTYNWLVNGNSIAITNTPELSTNMLSSGDQIIVEMTSSAACVTTEIASSNELVAEIADAVVPEVEVVASELEICEGEDITFTATPVNNSGGDSPSYQWFINDVAETSGQSTFTSNDLNDGDVVSILMTSNALCASPDNATSAVEAISVFPLPETPVITASGNVLTASTSAGYQWYFNGTPIDGATGESYTPTATGDYSVVVTSANGCESGFSNVINFIIDSVNDLSFGMFSVYPNPFNNEIKIQSNAQKVIDKLSIIDATGRCVMTENNLPSNHLINCPDWSSGLYILRITIGSETREFKLSKM